MGKYDENTKNYFSDNGKFSELINNALYKGKPVVKPELLTEGNVQPTSFPGIRDLARQYAVKKNGVTTYVIYGIENQQNAVYDEPAKVMWYDAGEYHSQAVQIKKENKRKFEEGALKKKRGGEYTEKFLKENKLKPVITVGIYWGSREWDAPVTLRQMLDIPDRRILESVPDYRPHILIPSRMTDEEISAYGRGLDLAFTLAKASGSRKEMRKLAKDKRFEKADKEIAVFLNRQFNLKIEIKEEGEESVNMCKGMDDWINEEKQLTAIEVTKQVSRATKLSALKANIHALLMEGSDDAFIKRIALQTSRISQTA